MSSCCPVGQPPSLLCLYGERSPRRPASGTLLAEGHRSVLALPPPCQVSALVEVRLVVVEAGSGAEVALDELPVLRGELAPVHRETTAARGLAFGVGVRRPAVTLERSVRVVHTGRLRAAALLRLCGLLRRLWRRGGHVVHRVRCGRLSGRLWLYRGSPETTLSRVLRGLVETLREGCGLHDDLTECRSLSEVRVHPERLHNLLFLLFDRAVRREPRVVVPLLGAELDRRVASVCHFLPFSRLVSIRGGSSCRRPACCCTCPVTPCVRRVRPLRRSLRCGQVR